MTIINLLLACLCFSGVLQPEPARPHVERNPAYTPDQWQRAGHAMVAIGDKLYVLGGIDNTGEHKAHARVDVYDVKERQWSTAAPMPTPRVFAGAAALGARIHVVAGLSDEDVKLQRAGAVHECYDPTTDSWKPLTPIPAPRSRLAVAVVNDRLYVLGGLETDAKEHRDSARVDVYDPAKDAWERGPDLPLARHAHAAAVIDGKIFVMGGYSLKEKLEPLARCDVLDVAQQTWSQGPDMTQTRSWFAVVEFDKTLVAIGGQDHPERLSAPFTKWEKLDVSDILDRRFAASVAAGEIFIFGGELKSGLRRFVLTKRD